MVTQCILCYWHSQTISFLSLTILQVRTSQKSILWLTRHFTILLSLCTLANQSLACDWPWLHHQPLTQVPDQPNRQRISFTKPFLTKIRTKMLMIGAVGTWSLNHFMWPSPSRSQPTLKAVLKKISIPLSSKRVKTDLSTLTSSRTIMTRKARTKMATSQMEAPAFSLRLRGPLLATSESRTLMTTKKRTTMKKTKKTSLQVKRRL